MKSTVASESRKAEIEHEKRAENIKETRKILMAYKCLEKLASLYWRKNIHNFLGIDGALEDNKIKTTKKDR
jgi:hypothetical protein